LFLANVGRVEKRGKYSYTTSRKNKEFGKKKIDKKIDKSLKTKSKVIKTKQRENNKNNTKTKGEQR